jgi:hypothetical protein
MQHISRNEEPDANKSGIVVRNEPFKREKCKKQKTTNVVVVIKRWEIAPRTTNHTRGPQVSRTKGSIRKELKGSRDSHVVKKSYLVRIVKGHQPSHLYRYEESVTRKRDSEGRTAWMIPNYLRINPRPIKAVF